MITHDAFIALTAGENNKRRKLLEVVHTNVDETNKCRIYFNKIIRRLTC